MVAARFGGGGVLAGYMALSGMNLVAERLCSRIKLFGSLTCVPGG